MDRLLSGDSDRIGNVTSTHPRSVARGPQPFLSVGFRDLYEQLWLGLPLDPVASQRETPPH